MTWIFEILASFSEGVAPVGGSTRVTKSRLYFSALLELVQPYPSPKVILDGRLHSFATGVKIFDLYFGLILSGCGPCGRVNLGCELKIVFFRLFGTRPTYSEP